MNNQSTLYVLTSLQKKRLDARLHVEARLTVLLAKEASYAALGKAKQFYALKLKYVDELEVIDRDLAEYGFMIRDAEACTV